MNPFKPTAGKMPPIVIGRENVLNDFREALINGTGAPGRIMLLTGKQGYGKTVLLTQLRKIAQEQQWNAISDTASTGLTERLLVALTQPSTQIHASLSPSVNLAGLGTVSIGEASVSKERAALDLREALLAAIQSKHIKKGKGLLITIDETQAISEQDLVNIATAVQHVITTLDEQNIADEEKKGIALVFAGLPRMVNELTNNRVTTFLRRALHRELHSVAIPDVKNAYIQSVRKSGKEISQSCALQAAELSGGYPYMVQLVGYYMWQAAQTEGSAEITAQHLKIGTADALLAFDDAVCEPILHELTASERQLLEAIAQVSTPQEAGATVAQLVAQTGRSRSWVNKYRMSLLAQNVIESPERGVLRISVPHLSDFLVKRSGKAV